VAKVGTSNQDHTISLKAAVRSCINKQTNQKSLELELYESSDIKIVLCMAVPD